MPELVKVLELVDTHCHLDWDRFDSDRDDVVVRAVNNGISRILIPGLELENFPKAQSLATRFEQVYLAVGVHPNSGKTWQKDSISQLKKLSVNPRVVAVGEIGLDYYWDKTPKDLQIEIFKSQLKAAEELNLPVIIHSRESMSDVLDILLSWQQGLKEKNSPLGERPGVLHSFSGTADDAKQAVDANFFIGITGPVTFKKADQLREVVKEIPLEKLLIETDSPFLTPEPYRGKRNEPGYVKYIAEQIARIRQMDAVKFAKQTKRNAKQLFQW